MSKRMSRGAAMPVKQALLRIYLEEKKMGHERFRSYHFRERVVSLHGESGGLKIRRERVGTVTTHLAPWSIG